MLRPVTWFVNLSLALCVVAGSSASANLQTDAGAGVLDQPLPTNNSAQKLTNPPSRPIIHSRNPKTVQQALRDELAQEQDVLKKLTREQLLEKAENGERAAQVVLAEDFAKEAAMLAFAPAAANDAFSDAIVWYIKAAKRGFPGAPSLDQAGVRFYPIRAQRSR